MTLIVTLEASSHLASAALYKKNSLNLNRSSCLTFIPPGQRYTGNYQHSLNSILLANIHRDEILADSSYKRRTEIHNISRMVVTCTSIVYSRHSPVDTSLSDSHRRPINPCHSQVEDIKHHPTVKRILR